MEWICDGCNKNLELGDFSKRCNICDFILCLKCINSSAKPYFITFHDDKNNISFYRCTKCECLETISTLER